MNVTKKSGQDIEDFLQEVQKQLGNNGVNVQHIALGEYEQTF